MSEKEKMIEGYLYSPEKDKELYEDRLKAKTLCYEYNNLPPRQIGERKALLKKILGSVREHYWIEQPFVCDYGYNIEIGNNFYANHNLIILDCAKVSFGNNVFIAPNCGFYTACHPIDTIMRIEGFEYALPINVGNNVWIGGNVTVLAGVTIGNNSVIGAGSVVTNDIPANVVAVGNPCRVIKEITKDIKDKYKVL